MKFACGLLRLNAEQVGELVLPLADERLRHDQQDALGAFRPALGDHQAGFDRLAEPDLVGEDAAALFQPPQREDHRVDLVRVRIDPRLPLRGGVALAVVRAANAHEVLGEQAEVEGVEGHSVCRLAPARPAGVEAWCVVIDNRPVNTAAVQPETSEAARLAHVQRMPSARPAWYAEKTSNGKAWRVPVTSTGNMIAEG